LDASQFLDINSRVLGGTIYFGRIVQQSGKNKILSTAGSGDLAYTSDDAAWNRVEACDLRAHLQTVLPRIPSGKYSWTAFFLQARVLREVKASFENTMRIGSGVSGLDNSQFFR
jgi:hypothetical protein